MEKRKASRRRGNKPKVENYYKILGVRANATPDKIKQKYIEMVKAFPPETHSEQFQQIRRAYEMLRDPAKRSEYDMMRKYGDQLETILDEAMDKMEREQWDKASELLQRALHISSDCIPARLGLAQLALIQGDEELFEEQFRHMFHSASAQDQKGRLIALKAGMLLETDRPEKALEVLNHSAEDTPEHHLYYNRLYIAIYRELGREEEAWALTESAIPSVETQSAEDIELFIEWINVMIELEKWNLWGKIQSRVRKFLKSIHNEEDKLMAVSALMYEHGEYSAVGRFREAEIFIDLAYYVDPKNPAVQKERKDTLEIARLEKEMDRMLNDKDLFPLVTIQAGEWFYEEFMDPAVAPLLRQTIPQALLNEMESMNEEFAAGIQRVRKKYPLNYRRYQNKWEELNAEKVSGLNREARRRLK